MIILFEENELKFSSLGMGVLKDAKECKVSESLNDSFELTMVYPYNGILYDQLKIDRIIFAPPNPYDEAQPFRIYSISKPIKGYVTVKAQHISYDLNGIPCRPINAGSLRDACDKIQNGSIISHNFKFYTDKSESKTFKTTGYYNMRALLMGDEGSLLEKFNLEAKFDKFNIYLLERRGSDKGATISYAKNLKDITHEINYEKLYNGVYPFFHQETQETTTNNTTDGFKQCYIVGNKPYQDGWLSYTPDGEPYHPVDESPIQIATEGNYYKKVYCWNTTSQRYVEKIYDEMLTLMDSVTGLLGQEQETPQWVVIDWSQITSLKLVIKAGEAGYFKLSTETEYTYHPKGDIVFQGSIKQTTDALILYYSQVIPPTSTAETEESTVTAHVELSDKIIWIDTELAKNMKVNRILTLDLTSEFDEAPDEDALRSKANEYIEKNKIGQYKFDTSVSFIDLSTTTEGKSYKNVDTVELGDTVKVTYNDIGIDVDLRVVETEYDVLLNRYSNITLGEKPEKLSSSSVQQGDGVSSLTNDTGYTDVTTVNKLVAKIITADYIKAKNAEMSKAMIEQLETARIRCTGILEASQFELDTLVAKMLTADNAVIKQTLEAGTVKVNGDITIASGSIKIQNTEVGTSFVVDRDGNVTANSLMITGGSIRINDTFEVTNDGELTAINARIEGHIVAQTGNIAGFDIQSAAIQYSNLNGYVHLGTDGIALGGLNTQTNIRAFQVNNDGSLYASNATIKGSIEATSGKIAGFTIAENTMTAGDIQGELIAISTGFYFYNKYWFLMAGGRKNQDNEYVGALFGVSKDGTLLAYKAEIIGNIVAQSGNIAGFTIQSDASDPAVTPSSGSISFGTRGYDDSVYIGTDGIELGQYFSVDANGNLIAKAGTIAGFTINEEYNSDETSENYGEFVKGYIAYDAGQLSKKYVYLGTDKIAIGKTSISDTTPVFSVNDEGLLIANNAQIKGTITAESGNIAGFNIHENYNSLHQFLNGYIAYGKTSLNDGSNGIYIGTDGISLGANSVFNVTPAGVLTASSVDITGTISTTSGMISGFTIQNGYLEYGKAYGESGYDDTIINDYVHVGVDAIKLGRTGRGTAGTPYSYPINISSKGNMTIGSNFSVDNTGIITATNAILSGQVTANSGKIGPLTVNSTQLKYSVNGTDYLSINTDDSGLWGDGSKPGIRINYLNIGKKYNDVTSVLAFSTIIYADRYSPNKFIAVNSGKMISQMYFNSDSLVIACGADYISTESPFVHVYLRWDHLRYIPAVIPKSISSLNSCIIIKEDIVKIAEDKWYNFTASDYGMTSISGVYAQKVYSSKPSLDGQTAGRAAIVVHNGSTWSVGNDTAKSDFHILIIGSY